MKDVPIRKDVRTNGARPPNDRPSADTRGGDRRITKLEAERLLDPAHGVLVLWDRGRIRPLPSERSKRCSARTFRSSTTRTMRTGSRRGRTTR
jgi:hypothetical protein